jgi:hypothetical protein
MFQRRLAESKNLRQSKIITYQNADNSLGNISGLDQRKIYGLQSVQLLKKKTELFKDIIM